MFVLFWLCRMVRNGKENIANNENQHGRSAKLFTWIITSFLVLRSQCCVFACALMKAKEKTLRTNKQLSAIKHLRIYLKRYGRKVYEMHGIGNAQKKECHQGDLLQTHTQTQLINCIINAYKTNKSQINHIERRFNFLPFMCVCV